MKNYTIDSSLTILRKQLTVIEQQIQELRMIQSRLLHRCVQMENARNYMETETAVVTETVQEQYLLTQKVDEPYRMSEISIATKKVLRRSFPESSACVFSERSHCSPAADPHRPVYGSIHRLSSDREDGRPEELMPDPRRNMRMHVSYRRLSFHRPLL